MAASIAIFSRACGECTRPIERAHKVHLGVPICQTCYERLFNRRVCSECGGSVRALMQDPAPVCSKCQNAKRTCVRCERPVPKAALIFQGKPVCSSCAHYFKEPKRCPRCDRLSTRMSRVTGVSDEPICERCQREFTNATCSVCGKHRVRYALTSEGKPLCKTCAANPKAKHNCPDCGVEIGGSDNTACFACSLIRSLRKKVETLAKSLAHPDCISLFRGFAEWSIDHNKVNLVLGKLPKVVEMLGRLENKSDSQLPIDPVLVKTLFTAEEIRLSGLFGMYLAEIGILTDAASERATASDVRRINSILLAASSQPWGGLLTSYADNLSSAEKPISTRTTRLYLRAALEFMQFSKIQHAKDITEEHVLSFLRHRPGHRASLFRWFSFLKSLGIRAPSLPTKRASRGVSVQAAAALVRNLLTGIQASDSPNARRALLAKLISITYDIPLLYVLSLERESCAISQESVRLCVDGAWVELLAPIDGYVRTHAYSSSSEVESSQKLFGGRMIGDSLSTSAVDYYVSKLDQ